MKKVFITRDISKDDLFYSELTESGYEVKGESFLTFTKVDFCVPNEGYQWIFFYSKKGVDFFLKQQKMLSHVRIGTIGKATARHLQSKYNITPTFIGESDPVFTAKLFQQQISSSDKVLFVRAKFSKKSVQQRIDSDQVLDLVVYDNQLKSNVSMDIDANIVVFTSPLNAKAFFNNGYATRSQKYISIGMTTGKELEEYIDCYDLAVEHSERGLIDAVLNQ